MKPSEFYEKYWKIDYGNGILVSPPALSEAEKEYLDNHVNNGCSYMKFIRKRKRQVSINIDILKNEMNKLPEFIKPLQP